MQLIWYLPSVIIGLTVGLSSGYWQLALISVLMVSMMLAVQLYRNRYPPFPADASVHVSAGQVAIDNRVLPKHELFWKRQWQEILLENFQRLTAPDYLTQLLVRKREEGFWITPSSELELWLGARSPTEQSIDLAKEGPHLVIVGPTGSGKSELLKLMLGSLLERQRVDLVLFDFKGGATLEKFSSVAIGIGTDLNLEAAEKLWDYILSQLASREQMFSEASVSELRYFNALGSELRPIVVVIDEFASALTSGAKATACIEDVCARGRSLGIHLIAASQSLTGISRALLTNLRARIAMASSDPIDFVQLGMNPNKISLPHVSGFAQAALATANRTAESFYFPLGFTPAPRKAVSTPAGEPPQLARSRLLRQMYSDPEPRPDLPLGPPSSPDSQLLSRMEGLR